MFRENWRKHAHLKARLVKERQMMSLMEKEIAIVIGDVVQNSENWVRMWVDTGHVVICDEAEIKAYRGIDVNGQLMWLVQHPKKSHGYHSCQADPFDAIAEAKSAWAERARIRAHWPQVRSLARSLVLGFETLTVTREDAYKSGLCSAGVDAFMTRIGLPQRQFLGGRTAALLMIIDRQLGFAVFSAYERELLLKGVARRRVGGGKFVERRT